MARRRVVVLGGGPAGCSAAMKASSLGAEVYLAEKDALGGVCVNKGCVPAKSWLKSAEVLQVIRSASRYGVVCSEPAVDLAQIKARVEAVIRSARERAAEAMESAGVQVVQGEGYVERPGVVRLKGDRARLRYDSLIVCTGSSPRFPDAPGFGAEGVLPGEEALFLSEVPSSIAVIGGGPTGLEIATLHRILGARVFLVEARDRLLPGLDEDLGATALAAAESMGIEIVLSKTIDRVSRLERGLLLTLSDGEAVEADFLAVAAGRKPNASGLNLREAGVSFDVLGFIEVDPPPRTRASSIYAAGDVTGRYMLAHAAMAQGECAGALAAGADARLEDVPLPRCVYALPEIASVGLSEDEARSAGYDLVVGVSSFAENALAECHGLLEGFVKIVGDRRSGRILGVHVAGPHASELVSEAAIAISFGSTMREWAKLPKPHPSYSEALSAALSSALKSAALT